MSLLSPSYEDEISLRHELPEGIGRKPIYSELGEYGQFVFEPHLLPSFYRVGSGDDLCYFIFDSGHFQGKTSAYEPLQREMFKTLCSDYVSPYKKLQRLFYFIMAGFYHKFQWALIFAIGIFCLGYLFSENTIVKTVSSTIASIGAMTVLLSFLFKQRNMVYTDSLELYANWQAQENPNPLIHTCQNVNTTDLIDWFNNFSGDSIPLIKEHKERLGTAISFFSKSQRGSGISTIYRFNGLSQPSQKQLSAEDRYLLAQLRTEKLWSQSSKHINQYCEWLGWDDGKKEAEKSHDLYLVAGWLKEELIKKYTRDIERGLERLISNKVERKSYFQRMDDESLFWLARPVKASNQKQPFLQWINEEITQWDGEIIYLTSEAAMGKSTTINLFGLAGCSDKLDSNILPIRIKIRELEEDIINFRNKTDEEFTSSLLSTLNIESSYKTNYALNHYLHPEIQSQPLLILDGMDEIKRDNQRILLERLSNQVDLKFPIIVTSRPSSLVSPESIPGGLHAQLCHLSAEQRMKILQNLEMSAQALESMQDYLSPELIDRPFALMIAAKMLRKSEEVEGVMGTRNDLSINKICKEYLQQFEYREDTKRTWDDDNSLRRQSKSALEIIATHQIAVMCGKIDEDTMPTIDTEIEKYLLKRSQINSDMILIDTWLEGFFAASSELFKASNWEDVLGYDDEPGRRSLVLRNYCCSAPPEETPNWNELGDYAPEVMHIASEEWLTMNLEKRQKLLQRFNIPTNQKGLINFSDQDNDLLNQCTISELLAIIHFHCSVMDSKKWKKGFVDHQWERMFKIFLNRMDQFISEEQKNLIREAKQPKPPKSSKPHHLMRNILSGNAAKYVKKLIPYSGNSEENSFSSVFKEDDNPISLFNVINYEIKNNHQESNVCTGISLIPLFANRPLFRFDAGVMMKHFNEDYSDVSGKYVDMLCKLAGITQQKNLEIATERGWRTFAESLELISKKEYLSNLKIDFEFSNKWFLTSQKNYQHLLLGASISKEKVIYFNAKLDSRSAHKFQKLPFISLIPSISYYTTKVDDIRLRYGMLASNDKASNIFAAPDNWHKLFRGKNKHIPNTELCSIINEFEQTQAKKFQTNSFYHELQIQLDNLGNKYGKVIGYLFHGNQSTWNRPHKWMYLPGLENTRLGGLAFEVDSKSAREFNRILPKHSPSNRWFSFDVHIRRDSAGYWNFEPEPSSLEVLCQSCLQKSVDPIIEPLLCEGCETEFSEEKEGPNVDAEEINQFLQDEFSKVYKKFGSKKDTWNTNIHDIKIDLDRKVATVFAPKKDHRKYFLGDKRDHKSFPKLKKKAPHNWIIFEVEESLQMRSQIKQVYVKPIASDESKIKEEE